MIFDQDNLWAAFQEVRTEKQPHPIRLMVIDEFKQWEANYRDRSIVAEPIRATKSHCLAQSSSLLTETLSIVQTDPFIKCLMEIYSSETKILQTDVEIEEVDLLNHAKQFSF